MVMRVAVWGIGRIIGWLVGARAGHNAVVTVAALRRCGVAVLRCACVINKRDAVGSFLGVGSALLSISGTV